MIFMKLKDGFITHSDGNEQFLVSTGTEFNGLVRSNGTAGFILSCLETETTQEEIVAKMLAKYDAPQEVISADVENILAELRKIGALDG
jgi:endonuclease III